MANFFGGAVNVMTWERTLIDLRQTGSVSDHAIAFQNITNASHGQRGYVGRIILLYYFFLRG